MIRTVMVTCALALTGLACAVDRPVESAPASDEVDQPIGAADMSSWAKSTEGSDIAARGTGYPCFCDYSCDATGEWFGAASYITALQACVRAKNACHAGGCSACTLDAAEIVRDCEP
jgi:hypothetical protein